MSTRVCKGPLSDDPTAPAIAMKTTNSGLDPACHNAKTIANSTSSTGMAASPRLRMTESRQEMYLLCLHVETKHFAGAMMSF